MMKRLASCLALAFLLCAFSSSLSAREFAYAIDVFSFQDGQGNPYLEVQVNIEAGTLTYRQTEDGQFIGEVDVLIFVQEEGQEKGADALKVQLRTELLSDTSSASLNQRLMDVRKIPVKPGKHVISGFLEDRNAIEKQEHKFEREVLIKPNTESGMGFSDILYLTDFKKSTTKNPYTRFGYDVVTRVSDNYFEDEDSLLFYVELYDVPGAETNENVFVHTYITDPALDKKLKKYQKTVRKKARKIDLYTSRFDISGLTSGTYVLNLEVYNGQNKLVASEGRKFYIYNNRLSVDYAEGPDMYDRYFGYNEEDLDAFIPTLAYISTSTEASFANSLVTFEDKKNYFYNFWEKRAKEGELAIQPWKQYRARIDYANQHYKAFRLEGWKTDRGRVLLQYGPPNDVEMNPGEALKYPNEIWRYNQLNAQNNIFFVFYDSDRITGRYQLLHSNLRGEVNNPRWQLELVRRIGNDGNLDIQDPYGGKN